MMETLTAALFIGVTCGVFRFWPLTVAGIVFIGFFSQARLVNAKIAMSEEVWRAAERGERHFSDADGASNALVVMTGWLPGVFMALLAYWIASRFFHRGLRRSAA